MVDLGCKCIVSWNRYCPVGRRCVRWEEAGRREQAVAAGWKVIEAEDGKEQG